MLYVLVHGAALAAALAGSPEEVRFEHAQLGPATAALPDAVGSERYTLTPVGDSPLVIVVDGDDPLVAGGRDAPAAPPPSWSTSPPPAAWCAVTRPVHPTGPVATTRQLRSRRAPRPPATPG